LATAYVDLRSDTVTRPTAAMRKAMAEAEVGDDHFGEDPTVRLLEEETARILGKESALFVPSGSMGNQIAIGIQTRRGDAVLLHERSHVAYSEEAALTSMLGLRLLPVAGDAGRLAPESIAAALDLAERETNGPVTLVELENSHNWAGGAVYDIERLRRAAQPARQRHLPVHLDGARLWNASVATDTPPAAFADVADTVMVCYSKGLGAPVGSAVAGPSALIGEARVLRKRFGGGMRQAGILAAGALHGLRHHRERLVEDHERARRLAEALSRVPGLAIDPSTVATNIVIVEVTPHERVQDLADRAAQAGVRLLVFGGPGRFRAATHLDVDDRGIDRAIEAIAAAARELGLGRA
jgi:threonine aldolase